MAQVRVSHGKTMKELVQQQRRALYDAGNRNLNMSLSLEAIEQIDALKRRYRLRSRDAVVARIIRKCMGSADADALTQRAADPRASYRRISPIVAGELVEFVKAVQVRFRGLAYGPVFEMLLAEVDGDLSPAPMPAQRRPEGYSARKHEPSPVAEAA